MTQEAFFEEINLARDFMCSTRTTPAQWEALIKRLGQLAIGADTPKDLRYIAEGQLFEAIQRRIFVEMKRTEAEL